ncbi:MAG: hypothetical protein RIQ53_4388 [Pseudomonadota bacterium]|jgi:Ser/Thr protein kinase RdoA (MazF antagonist)
MQETPRGAAAPHPYAALEPRHVLDALEAVGIRADGRLLQLNSYENRVFLVHDEDGRALVAKFYRPGRWSDAQLAEEHRLLAELQAEDLPVIAPLALQPDGRDAQAIAQAPASLARVRLRPGDAGAEGPSLALAVWPCRAGHGPELDDPSTLRWLGRLMARLHQVGARERFSARPTLDAEAFGWQSHARLRDDGHITPAEWPAWDSACRQALELATQALADTPTATLRLHGDCHPGNILWRSPDGDDARRGPQLVDFDDARNGPAVQDLWMLLSGEREAMQQQLGAVLSGYRQIRRFDGRELRLIEPLRTLRMVHHSAWLAERWDDPAFPAAFPWFGTPAWWSQQTVQLRQQIEAMTEPPLDDPADWGLDD